MAKHIVEVVEPFEYTHKMGAMVINGVEVSPAREFKSAYSGLLEFSNKAEAMAFSKFHGAKVKYIGKKNAG